MGKNKTMKMSLHPKCETIAMTLLSVYTKKGLECKLNVKLNVI